MLIDFVLRKSAMFESVSHPSAPLQQPVSLSPLSPFATASSRRLNQPCLRAVCACDPAPAARGARTAEQLGGGFQWRRVGDRVARAGGGKGPLIFLYFFDDSGFVVSSVVSSASTSLSFHILVGKMGTCPVRYGWRAIMAQRIGKILPSSHP